MFGFAQRGAAAAARDNVFHPLTYEGAVDLDSVADPAERASLEAQISEFGQTPRQLFTQPHVPRAAAPPLMDEKAATAAAREGGSITIALVRTLLAAVGAPPGGSSGGSGAPSVGASAASSSLPPSPAASPGRVHAGGGGGGYLGEPSFGLPRQPGSPQRALGDGGFPSLQRQQQQPQQQLFAGPLPPQQPSRGFGWGGADVAPAPAPERVGLAQIQQSASGYGAGGGGAAGFSGQATNAGGARQRPADGSAFVDGTKLSQQQERRVVRACDGLPLVSRV